DGGHGQHYPPSSARMTPSSATITDWRRMLSRSPENRRVSERTPPALAQAKHTVPTGFSGVPPVGPATPVMDTATLALLRSSAPRAISLAVSSLTAPCAWRVSVRTPRSSSLAALE